MQNEDKGDSQQVLIRDLEGGKTTKRKVSEMNWSTKGWSGRQMRGRYVGCPESTDGSMFNITLGDSGNMSVIPAPRTELLKSTRA